MSLPEVVGISGTFASGKDTLAEYLVKKFGYHHVSSSDMIRKVAQERYGSIERPILRKTGIELRNENGSGVLAEKALEAYSRPIIISGIRTVGEAQAIKNTDGVMVFVDADRRLRYERMQKRARDDESKISFEEFISREEEESSNNDESSQNLSAVMQESDIILSNSGSIDEFLSQAIAKLGNLK